VIYHTRYEILV